MARPDSRISSKIMCKFLIIYKITDDRGIEPSVWNEHHQCWDDAEGDDYMYSKEYVEAWLPIPPLKGGSDTFDETDK